MTTYEQLHKSYAKLEKVTQTGDMKKALRICNASALGELMELQNHFLCSSQSKRTRNKSVSGKGCLSHEDGEVCRRSQCTPRDAEVDS